MRGGRRTFIYQDDIFVRRKRGGSGFQREGEIERKKERGAGLTGAAAGGRSELHCSRADAAPLYLKTAFFEEMGVQKREIKRQKDISVAALLT